ncbi:glycosyltransferase [Nonomuraea sp. NPDC050153]|uniref:glycosyltransferase n=1 Tax=Nonomuraea sp. NPDC050153 TaxID=3364359 RepID=UPI00379CB750
MHIVKVAYEATAFDVRLTRGGTATMVWELARKYVAAGHRVSVVTPAHGNVDHLRQEYGVTEYAMPDRHAVPLVLDPRIWPAHGPELELPLETRAYLMRREGVDIYFLSDEYLDLLPETLYPANEMQGSDLAFMKPLVFQVDAIRFLERHLDGEDTVVQCYEPAYHYLIPAVLKDTTTVSTVVVNTRIDDAVYRPQLERLLRRHHAEIDLDRYVDPVRDDPLSTALRDYHRPSHLKQDHGSDYVCYFAMVADCADLVDFVSPGQRDYYSTYRDAPFEARFEQLQVSRVVRETAAKHVVGGCALPDRWLQRDPRAVDRKAVLTGLGLRPDRPTFYHAARLAQNHKGQTELFRAIDEVLRIDSEVNFVIRCAVAAAGRDSAGDPFFREVAQRHPDNIHLDWRMVEEEVLFEHAACADFCLFPSKFELDGFLITMGEAMACGAVPIATAQETLRHYLHHLPVSHPEATGFAVPRSFRSDDRVMAVRLSDRIAEAARIHREEPGTYARLSRNCVDLAGTFTWERSAAERLAWFTGNRRDNPGDRLARNRRDDFRDRVIEYGWFDILDDDAWQADRDRIREAALLRGDLAAYRRCAEVDAAVDPAAAARLFDAAYARADFGRCEELAPLVDQARRRTLHGRCRATGQLVVYSLPHAEQVDLIVPARLSDGVGSGNRHTYPLTRRGVEFVARLPEEMAGRGLVFMITLGTGRVAWDLARPAT